MIFLTDTDTYMRIPVLIYQYGYTSILVKSIRLSLNLSIFLCGAFIEKRLTTPEDIVNDLAQSDITIEAKDIQRISKDESAVHSYKIRVPAADQTVDQNEAAPVNKVPIQPSVQQDLIPTSNRFGPLDNDADTVSQTPMDVDKKNL